MPGTQSLGTFSKELLSTQVHNVLEDYRSMKDGKYPVAEDWLDAAERWDGGELVVIPWETEDHSVGTALDHGYESINQWIQTTMVPGTATPAWFVQPAMISKVDRTINSGKGKVIDRAKKNALNVERHIRRNIQRMVLRGPAASNLWAGISQMANWNTLNGTDNGAGFVEAQATGTNTLHGLAKTAYDPAIWPKFHNGYYDGQSAAGTYLLNNMYQTWIDLGIRDGEPVPSEYKWYLSPLAAGFMKRSLRTLEQYVAKGEMDDMARRPTMHGGVPLVPVADLPQNGQTTAGTKWSALLVNWGRGVRVMLYQEWELDTTDYEDVPGTAGVQAMLTYLGGQMICQEPGLMAVIKNAEVF